MAAVILALVASAALAGPAFSLGVGSVAGAPAALHALSSAAGTGPSLPRSASGAPRSPSGVSNTTPNWTDQCDAPCSADRAMVAYDAADGYVLYLDGVGNGTDTMPFNPQPLWSYHAGNWTARSASTLPPYREFGSMVYDAADGYVLLFGGCRVGTNCTSGGALGDSWSYVGGNWTQLHPSPSPAARFGASLAYDSALGEVVLFGGVAANGSRLNDTWAFSGGRWTQLHPAGSPSARGYAALSDDPAGHNLLLFGGLNGSGTLGDTWNFSGGNWTNLHPSSSPPSSYGGAMAYDSAARELVLLPGGSPNSYRFSGGSWHSIGHVLNGTNFRFSSLANDPADSTLLLIGGGIPGCNQKIPCGTSFTLVAGAWNMSIVAPPPRFGAAFAYDPTDGYAVLFGGESRSGTLLGDTWSYSAGRWTELSPTSSPSARFGASMAWDAADGYLLLFGGFGTRSYNDTWSFAGGQWKLLSPSRSPPIRGGSLMSYDPSAGAIVLFDEPTNGKGPYTNATWTYLSGVWTPQSSAGGPGALPNSLTYDPTLSGVVALAIPSSSTKVAAYLFGSGGWSSLSYKKPPTSLGTAVYDAADGYLLMFNGKGQSWRLNSTGWSELSPAIAPQGRSFAGVVFDSGDGYVLLVEGIDLLHDSLFMFGDSWSY